MLSHVPPLVILPATTGLLQLTKINGKFPYLAYHTGIRYFSNTDGSFIWNVEREKQSYIYYAGY